MKHEFRMYVGPMFGGKTTRMLSQVERYRYQDEEIFAFLESLSQTQFQSINKFFETMPQCVSEANVSCPDCDWSTSFKLRGITDFFV